MSKAIRTNLPCPQPNCNSSDAYTEYDDGHGHCYSCGKTVQPNQQASDDKTTGLFELRDYRGFSLNTLRRYGVLTKVGLSEESLGVIYPYSESASKVRLFPKKFFTQGNISDAGCFGKLAFNAGEALAITITEGEDDALAAFEMLGSKYPVLSVQSASSAKKNLITDYDYVNSFDKIYLCFDNDEAGEKAHAACSTLFDFKKVYKVPLTKYKDAQQYHEAKETKAFLSAWHNAKRYQPDNLISSFAEFDEIIAEEVKRSEVTYPFPSLNDKLYGIRGGEIVLITAPSGVGKTEFVRSIEHHLLKSTDANIGIIHLEENKARTIKGLVGYELGLPVHLPTIKSDPKDLQDVFHKLCSNRERLFLYNHFGSDDPDVVLSNIRFMVSACDCKYVVLDHITMVVTGSETEDERRQLDYLATKLRMLVEELGFTLFLVSQLNDDGRTRGSRTIHHIADAHITLSRNPLAEYEQERNKTLLTLTKNRFGSITGKACTLKFNPQTFRLAEDDNISLPPVTTEESPYVN